MLVQDTIRGRQWRSTVRADAGKLKKAYRAAMRSGEKNAAQEWLCDNAYLFERISREVYRSLRFLPPLPAGAHGKPGLFALCEAVYDELPEWTQEALTKYFSDAGVTSAEAEAIPIVLQAVILRRAAQGSADAKAISKAVRILHTLPDMDFEALSCAVSPMEKLLRQDPSGVYAQMQETSRAQYRGLLLSYAAKHRLDADKHTQEILERARQGKTMRMRHVGAYILPPPPKARGTFFLLLEALLPLAISVGFGVWLQRVYVPFLLVLPLWEITAGFLMRLSQRGVPSLRMPRMQMQTVPPQRQTLLTVSTLLPAAAKAEKLREHLEQLYLSNGQEHIKVCLLADLKNAGTPEKPEDAADIAAAARLIESLNRCYGGGFILAIRPRVYAPTEGCYSGWERKRGAITQLVREIMGKTGGFLHLSGDTQTLQKTRYLLALDSDTQLPMDAAVQMVSVAAHPLQEAVVDRQHGAVTAGYGVLAPRVCTDVSSRQTPFQRILCGDCGLSVYDNVVSERYQDLFGEGIFAGKGLIDVRAFYAVLDDSLPTGRILSHDSLEGGFLRCGYLSDVQVSDGFPKDPRSYLERLGRWVRGDWQNLAFVFQKSSLNALSRYKLLDNMRHSLTAAVRLGVLLACIFLPPEVSVWAAAVCVLSAAGGDFAAAVRSLFAGGFSAVSRLFYSPAVPTALGDLLRGFVRILQLPQEGLRCAVSIVLALYRSFISKKRLLDWTTFAQSDAGGSARRTLADCLWIAAVSAALFVSGKPHLKLIALLFLADIPFLLLSGKPTAPQTRQLSYLERDKLTSYAAAMWNFFAETCDFRHNYLPPDNIQETPVYRVAHRTSPTNIGLMLLCVLTARDFGFIDSAELCRRLQNSLGSIEQLETYCGNLLNWYDTQTLKPLQPAYVSSVDCGNFLCCLKALQQGLGEYTAQEPALQGIVDRVQHILDNADLSVFYNERRKLFHIGLDPASGKRSDSYYDLLMSEARMMGYYAVAHRAVEKKHWAALSRTMSKVGRYMGPVSWTGTMFEYFMPYLFLPSQSGTLGYEALKFCAWCQKKRVRGDVPFGISESGFYAFDRDLNYQYKAHGVQCLGLRRELDAETVISPYSTFLLMQLEPHAALRNLRRLEKMQMCGRWGFYEAVDFTPAHTDGRPYAVVRSYMAHHVGMSLLAVNNVLQDGIFRRRFMRDKEMRAAQSLLQEGVPTDAYVFKNKATRETPLPRERVEAHKREITDASPMAPNARVWTNGELSLCASDVGASKVVYRGVSLFRHSTDLLRRPQGPVAIVQTEKLSLPFAPMVDYSVQGKYRCTFSGSDVRYFASAQGISMRVRISVHPETAALQYTFSVRNSGKQPLSGDLLFYAEPSLTAHEEAENHPAFSKLFVEDRFDEQNRVFLYRKRERNGSRGVCMAAGFLKPTTFYSTCAKVAALQTGYGIGSLLRGNVRFEACAGGGDCCLAMQVPFKLPPHGTAEWNFAVTVASTQQEAVQKLLNLRETGVRKGAGSLFRDGKMESVLSEKMLPGIVFGVRDAENVRALRRNGLPLRHIWRFGVSGTHPVIFKEITDAQEMSSVIPYVRAVSRLQRAGFYCDLILGYTEGGEYDSPVLHAVRKMLREERAPADGIYPVNLTQFSEADKQFLQSVSVFSLHETHTPPKPMEICPVKDCKSTAKSVKLYSFTDDKIDIPKKGEKPYLPWCLVLSNPNFGTMVSDKSLGFTWAMNAHENKLTPWENDIAADNRGELLLLCENGKYYDLLRCAGAEFSPKQAQWTGKVGTLCYRVRVGVPERLLCKRCTVELWRENGEEAPAELIYYTEPILGSGQRDAEYVQAAERENGLLIRNPCAVVRGSAYLSVDGGADAVYTDRGVFWYGVSCETFACTCAAVAKKLPVVCAKAQTVTFNFSFAVNESAALHMPKLPPKKLPMAGSITVQSPQASFDRMVNVWLPWQIRSCRIQGRTGFYQCGGAWGFRDQIQDVSAFLMTDPDLVRRHILRCAAVQFKEGDVLHWWHRLPPEDGGLRGVRTRYRDDLLWLPWLVGQYVHVTGDRSVLSEVVPYLAAEPLTDKENERYFTPQIGAEKGSVLEHCLRAVDYALQKGEHGLLLIGGGDWNDGFNTVGIEGKGESVWLTMFLIVVLQTILPYCPEEKSVAYKQQIQTLRQAIEQNAWDGDHYLRAFMDDGTPIGGKAGEVCRIDSVAQSFAFFAGLSAERTKIALHTAEQWLTEKEKGIVKLLDPPFTQDGIRAGYITAYPPGIRENGGQYTHAAVWLCDALIRSGRAQAGYAMFRRLNPSAFCEDAVRCARYGGEPYALAGDIPTVEKRIGCTGWSLYTGSAAWMYRTAVETILGVHREGDKITLKPHIIDELLPLNVKIVINNTEINVKIEKKEAKTMIVRGQKVESLPLNGTVYHVKLE